MHLRLVEVYHVDIVLSLAQQFSQGRLDGLGKAVGMCEVQGAWCGLWEIGSLLPILD